MPEGRKDKPIEKSSSSFGGRMGMVTSLVLMNGFVLAVAAFLILLFTTSDMREMDARNMTRDVLHSMKESLLETEKSVHALAYFYSTMAETASEDGRVTMGMQKMLTDNARFEGVVWATEKDVWRYHDIANEKHFHSRAESPDMPAYQDIFRAVFNRPYNQMVYLRQLPGAPKTAEPVIGLAVKVRLSDGSNGVLLALTPPAKMFGGAWTMRREDIARLLIRDRDTNEVLISRNFGVEETGVAAFNNIAISNILQLGEKYWDVNFDVRPTLLSKILTASPWLALALILFLTVLSATITERRHRQDQKLAAMSRDLEGAHTELQSKISERDKLFHALRKSERENRAVINSVSDVIFETDESGKIVFLNETWKRITHLEVTETIGHSLFQMLEPADQVKQKEAFEELVRGERQAYRVETRLSLGQGLFKPVEIAFSMLRMAEDKSVRVVGTITDIEKRRRAEAAVREAEQRFRAIFENSISGIYQASPEGRFISANSSMAEILGYSSAQELISSVANIAHDVYVNPDDHKAYVQKLLFEGRVSGIETEVRSKDGRKLWIMENARVVRNEKGGVEYYEGSIWDVTERREAEEVMRQARLQAEISSRTRMEFLANMSHELRTPLNAVIGFSEIIKDEVMGPLGVDVYKEYAQDIYDSGNYLLKVISEILEVSKIETGNRELTVSNFRLPKALKSCMIIMSTRVEQSGVDVKIDLPEDLPELLAEELGIKQVMLNLIGNAIKFTPKGGHVTVTAKVEETGEMVIDVTDTGIGMSEEEIKKAMQPFTKIDTSFSGMKAGTGLGLTIVESLVRLHGGVFKLISEKGKGTTARVILPPNRVLRQEPVDTSSAQAGHLKVIK